MILVLYLYNNFLENFYDNLLFLYFWNKNNREKEHKVNIKYIYLKSCLKIIV